MSNLSKRKYNNTLRTERGQQTRDRIMEALGTQLADHSLQELSVARIAEQAGVSQPTVYRYYPNREALMDAFQAWIFRGRKGPQVPETEAELEVFAQQLFPALDEHRTYVRAGFAAEVGRAFRKHTRAPRTAQFKKLLSQVTEGLDPDEALRISAVLRYLNSSSAYVQIEDDYGLPGAESGPAVSWATRVLLAELRRMKTRRAKAKGQ